MTIVTILTSRAQIEQAIQGLRGRPYTIILQCSASQAPALREIVLGIPHVELHPFDLGTMRQYERDNVSRAIYDRSYRSHATPTVYLCTDDLRGFPTTVLNRAEIFKAEIEAEPA